MPGGQGRVPLAVGDVREGTDRAVAAQALEGLAVMATPQAAIDAPMPTRHTVGVPERTCLWMSSYPDIDRALALHRLVERRLNRTSIDTAAAIGP